MEVLFHVGATTVRSHAEMLFPMWATKGCLQPFRFKDLDDGIRASLEDDLKSLLNISPNAPADEPEFAVSFPDCRAALSKIYSFRMPLSCH